MKLVVGLGNPGKKYTDSKHNIGFMSLDSYASVNKIKYKKSIKFTSEIVKMDDYILLKPKTFMNNSGIAVRKICDYYKIASEDVMVVFDDLNLPFAKLRLRTSGSAGGHNGIKSITAHLGTDNFKRLRVGIGRDDGKEMKDDVLSSFNKSELNHLNDLQLDISNIIDQFVENQDFEKIMNQYN
ncbi:MAG: aminoacyl-tRNA hydrolase [Bacilli bacterium]|nr:aminoacyl-tRNA hydrolase [Bacilli bacterium]